MTIQIKKCFLSACFLLGLLTIHYSSYAQAKAISLSTISQGQKLNGFTATAVYLNDAGQPMGGRFIHDKTGFTLDLLQIESVPQTFIWVNSFPVSDKGEPHTQEHLLITKGNKGHELNTRQGMSLTLSNAFTSQTHTAYNFYTGAGSKVFFDLFEKYLDALLYPDYTPEEVNREVCNWGVSQNPDKTLKIEEKGSVYNEMKTSMTNPFYVIYNNINRMIYGDAHPLSYSSGGLPAGIRELGPAEIQKFHDANYHLWNMGAITSLPRTLALADILTETNNSLNRLEPNPPVRPASALKMPPAQPVEPGMVRIVDYPSKNEQESGNMLLAFPANRTLSATDELLLGTFMNVIAGDANTNLYKKFIDSKTREIDLGAQSIYGYVDDNMGQPVFIGLNDISAENLTTEKAEIVRQKIMDEFSRIASFKDNSPELIEFNNRFKNNIINQKRGLAKFINTPPKFGFRNTYDSWYAQLDEMTKINDFKKSIILKPQFEEIEKLLQSGKNFWTAYLAEWKLIGSKPYVVVSKASAALIDKNETERKERVKKELTVLKVKYNVTDDQAAIVKYKADYDANTAQLENLEKAHSSKFIDNPPMTVDDELDFKESTLSGNIKMVASTFNNMTSATTGIDFSMQGVRDEQLVYLAMLPELLTSTGVIKDGKAISYEDMSELLQQEILALECNYRTNFNTGRAELQVTGSGNNTEEAQRSIQWMNMVLQHPNWTKENLSRIRDLVDQRLAAIRKTMQGREEGWVDDPKDAYRRQDNPILLSTSSFLTRAHHIFRLRWMLTDAGDDINKKAIDAFLKKLATVTESRDTLKSLLAIIHADTVKARSLTGKMKDILEAQYTLPKTAKKLSADAAGDLEQVLNDIPDNSLQQDWQYLCTQIAKDLAKGPEQTLEEMDALRKSILKKSNARMFMIASGPTQQKLSTDINTLIAGLDNSAAIVIESKKLIIDDRVKERYLTNDKPVFVGLMNPNSQTGVFMNSAKLTSYKDTSRENLLRYLAAGLYAGGGKQSVYTKTTGAGLSYSTGVWASAGAGLFNYYAERTPELPQTLRFVIDEIKKSPVDPSLGEYVIAGAFGGIRSADAYESRGEAMAANLKDGYTPDVVRRFRSAILQLRKMPDLVSEIYKRKDMVYEKILPGYGTSAKNVTGGTFYVIGNEKQMTAYEAYLKSVEGPETKLYRLYPRDYWIIGK